MSTLREEVDGLLALAGRLLGSGASDRLAEIEARLDEPLRVAIAGKVKAGKSTLLNALVGEELAPTDEGECTRIVTWYRNGHRYHVELHPADGDPRPAPFQRDSGAIDVDLGGLDARAVDHLEVEWPASNLVDLTLIDTPGIASLTADLSQRTHDFLDPDDDRVTQADAVVYLMRHLHASDVDFLEAFHDQGQAEPNPVNTIAVLSRADEIACGRPDAMESADRIARRYRQDPKVRRLAQTVVPLAGLLAETGQTLREAEFQALRTLAGSERETLDAALVSADRFVSSDRLPGLTDLERRHLLDRLGLFGIRTAIDLLADRGVDSASALADALVDTSGLSALRHSLVGQFADRSEVLKARSALLALDALATAVGSAGAELAAAVERVLANTHDFRELGLLHALRSGNVAGKAADLARLERVLGGQGRSPAERLGAAEGDSEDLGARVADELTYWQRKAENPLTTKDLADACRVAIRTCEGLLTAG